MAISEYCKNCTHSRGWHHLIGDCELCFCDEFVEQEIKDKDEQ